MYAFITFVHVVNCALLIVSVLLQSSKGSGLAGAFGGQGTQAVFGGRGAGTFLSRATSILAIVFMVTSLTLTLHGGPRGGKKSALAEAAKKEGVAAPFQQPEAQLPTAGGAPLGVPEAGSPAETPAGTAAGTPAGGATSPATGTDAAQPPPGAPNEPPPSGGN